MVDRLTEILDSEGMTFLGYDLSKGPYISEPAGSERSPRAISIIDMRIERP